MKNESPQKKMLDKIFDTLKEVGIQPYRQEDKAIHAVIHFSRTDDCIYLESDEDEGCHLTISLHTDWATLAKEFDMHGEEYENDQEKAAALLSHANWMAAPVLKALLKECSIDQCGIPRRTEHGVEYLFFLQKCDSCADILRQFFLNADGVGRILSYPPRKRMSRN